MWMELNLLIGGLCLGLALWLRPWRMLDGPLLTPALAGLVLLPWLWLLPQKMPQGLQAPAEHHRNSNRRSIDGAP